MNNLFSCPSCQESIDPTTQVCPHCQYTVQQTCSGCQALVLSTYKFCPACGIPLGDDGSVLSYADLKKSAAQNREQLINYAQDLSDLYAWKRQLEQYLPSGLLDKVSNTEQAVVGERRYLTVLFSDVVGFTRLSSTLDAESVFMLMNDCFRQLVAEVYRYGGTIDKFLGDGMMALFGAPISHGNDTERAVRAALGMQEAMVRFNQKVLPTLGSALSLRVGITGGEAIAGLVGVKGRQSYTVMGSTVNLASRLEGACTPGSVLVNEDIYNQTASLFNYRVLTPIDVKGYRDPVPVFEVTGQQGMAKSFSQLPAETLSPFIGRRDELEKLQTITNANTETTGRIIFVSGDSGVGKTRLMMEWQNHFPTDWQVWFGSAQSFSQSGYDIWQQIILDGLSIRQASKERTVELLRDALEGEALLPFLIFLLYGKTPETEMISSLEPEQLKEQTFLAVQRLLQMTAKQSPLLILLDNFQWVDRLSQELMRSMFELAPTLPIVFCMISRPDGEGFYDFVEQTKASCPEEMVDIRLNGLSRTDCEAFLFQLLPIPDLSPQIQQHILARAQNNPYHLEEIVSFIVNRGYVAQHKDGWKIVDEAGLLQASLPGTLRSLIQAQIDILPNEAQQILAYASVLGSNFAASLFFRVLQQVPQLSKIDLHLDNLVEQTILTFDGRNYHFVHNVVQETLYQTLLTERRQHIHAQIGEALEQGEYVDGGLETELLAYHFTEANEPAKAIPYLIAAGYRASSQFANEHALQNFLAVLSLLPEVPRMAVREVEVLKAVGDLYQHLGDYDESLSYYERAASQANAINQWADCNRLAARIWRLKGDMKEAQNRLNLALQRINDHPDQTAINNVVLGRIYAEIGLLYMYQRDFAQAENWGIEAVSTLSQAQALGDLARSLNALAGVYFFQNRWHEASQQLERAYTIQEQIGDQMGIASSLGNLGMLYVTDCQWDRAIDVFNQTIAMCNEMGALGAALENAHNNIAYLYLHQGEFDLAETHLQQSLSLKADSDASLEMAASLNNLGLSRLLQKKYEEAEMLIEKSIALNQGKRKSDALCEATRYLAEIKLAAGDRRDALRLCEQALQQAEEISSKVDEGITLRALAQVYIAFDEPRLALQKAEESLAILQSVNYAYEAARTELILAQIAFWQAEFDQGQSHLDLAYRVLRPLRAKPDLEFAQLLDQHKETSPENLRA
ncbi:MAG: tetratricopeptide repeat protein [Chloroflexota bacterium]